MINRNSFFFRKVYVIFCASLFSLSVLAQVNKPSAGPQPARLRSLIRPVSTNPEILADNRVIFRLYAPEANKVSVSGEWMTATVKAEDMVKGDTGLWTLTVGDH